MKRIAIILAAGSGARLGDELPKGFVRIGDKTVLGLTLSRFREVSPLDLILLVVPQSHTSGGREAASEAETSAPVEVIGGGGTRQGSVASALKWLREQGKADSNDLILIHDAARTFVSPELIEKTFGGAETCGAVTTAIPQAASLKRVDPELLRVRESVPREELWEVQTPQAFRFELLERAHQAEGISLATDDASLVERLAEVRVVPGEPRNFKITTQFDLQAARLLFESERS